MPAIRPAKRKGKPASPRKRASAGQRAKIEVSEQERNHLIQDIAYFHAERFRRVEGERCRDEDRREAEGEIKAVLKRCRKR